MRCQTKLLLEDLFELQDFDHFLELEMVAKNLLLDIVKINSFDLLDPCQPLQCLLNNRVFHLNDRPLLHIGLKQAVELG